MSDPAPVTRCLVIDLGAGSGRAMIARLRDGHLDLTEIHRFSGLATTREDGPHWDLAALLGHVDDALRRAAMLGEPPDSIGIDSWGLDYALLDADGRALIDPHHYRHPRSARGQAACPVPAAEMFALTGAQDFPIKTVFQLLDECRTAPARIAAADTLLMIADLVAWHLTGARRGEITLAATSGLLDRHRTGWCADLAEQLTIPLRLLPPLIRPGARIGALRSLPGLPPGWAGTPVIAVAAHDTASAVAALPMHDDAAFLICGSWLLFGVELPLGDFTPQAEDLGFGYESGIDGRQILVRSLNGLHLVQKLRQAWHARTGEDVDYATLARLVAQAAETEAADGPVADTEAAGFFDPVDIVAAIGADCAARGLPMPADLGSLALALYRGIADAVARALAALRQLGRAPATLVLCGGGAQDPTLRALVGAATGCRMQVGPVEATAFGNAIVQLQGLGRLASLEAGRALVAASVAVAPHPP